MPATAFLADAEPSRAEIDALKEPAVIEFGTDWCGYCRRAQPMIGAALAQYPQLRHIRVEDGPGRRLGRSYRVKLWPTLIFLERGREVRRLVRPDAPGELDAALAQIAFAT